MMLMFALPTHCYDTHDIYFYCCFLYTEWVSEWPVHSTPRTQRNNTTLAASLQDTSPEGKDNRSQVFGTFAIVMDAETAYVDSRNCYKRHESRFQGS